MPGTWQGRECLHVTGPDDREVPVVKRGDLGQPKALGLLRTLRREVR
jgi:hypothetical protein